MFKKASFSVCLAIFLAPLLFMAAPAQASDSRWIITKDHWSEYDEKGYQDFIRRIGEADCWSLDECLKDPAANPFIDSDPRGVKWLVDCADTPYVLRAYYAWKNGLPFSYATAMQSADGPGTDIRYSPSGNVVVARKDVPATANGVAAVPIIMSLPWTVSTAMYRHNADSDDPVMFNDMYSPRLDRRSIVPGTIAYDVNGHAAIIWKVESGGRLLIFSSHPDHTLSRSYVGKEFLRTSPALGSIFQKWRPIRLEGYRKLPNGTLVGGKIVAARNSEIEDYSLEQYTGNPPISPYLWSQAKWEADGASVDFYKYLRSRMSVGELEYHPLEEMKAVMQSLCQDLKSRKKAVEISLERNINNMTPPDRLPGNIYGTDGVWELYSTPSRDARLKTGFKELYDQTVEFVKLKLVNNPRLKYEGEHLEADLLALYKKQSAACVISYTNSNGKSVPLTFDDILNRLFKLSFDPYQCVERRWGATDPAELASCRDDANKQRWYEAQQNLRNQIDRTYDVDMGYTADELIRGPWGLYTGRGVVEPPVVNVRDYLEGAVQRRSADAGVVANPVATP